LTKKKKKEQQIFFLKFWFLSNLINAFSSAQKKPKTKIMKKNAEKKDS